MELTGHQKPPPQVHNFKCYREFLKQYFEYRKSLRSSFSYRQFSNLVGLKSPNYLQLVIQGSRNLTSMTAKSIAEAIKLGPNEKTLFLALVEMDNAILPEERRKAEKSYFQSLRKIETKYLSEDHLAVLSEWHHFAVRELVLLKGFEPSGEYISEKLSGLISPSQAEESLKLLMRMGMVKIESGKYSIAESFLDTGHDLFRHSLMQRYHAQLLQAWAKGLDRLGSATEQELGLLNIPIPVTKIPELKNKIRDFQDEIIGWAQGLDQPEEFVQLGTYLMKFGEK